MDENGCYTTDAGPSLAGLYVLTNGTDSILAHLKSNNLLLQVEKYVHSYPYDWRTNTPVIIRASQQWFFDTTAIKDKAVVSNSFMLLIYSTLLLATTHTHTHSEYFPNGLTNNNKMYLEQCIQK